MQSLVYFLLWAGFIFLMMRLGCGAHIMGHGHGRHDSHPQRPLPPEKAVDPVCRMTVETAKAKSALYRGEVYYFCSQDCRAKFESDPRSYPQSADPGSNRLGQQHDG